MALHWGSPEVLRHLVRPGWVRVCIIRGEHLLRWYVQPHHGNRVKGCSRGVQSTIMIHHVQSSSQEHWTGFNTETVIAPDNIFYHFLGRRSRTALIFLKITPYPTQPDELRDCLPMRQSKWRTGLPRNSIRIHRQFAWGDIGRHIRSSRNPPTNLH